MRSGLTPLDVESFAGHVLAADTASLDPEHRLNATLRRQGAGVVPTVVALHPCERRATLYSAGLKARLDVPYGWHAIDDGRRLLIFEPSGEVQIDVHAVVRETPCDEEIFRQLEHEARGSYPHPRCERFERGGLSGLSIRDISDGPQPLEQHCLIAPGAGPGSAVRARVTSTPARSSGACGLAAAILRGIEFGSAPVQPIER